ncbi:MAG: hypothetical protein AB9835_14410 [Eubacteriales bacterium]
MKTNWKRLVNPDYLGAYSLDDGNEKYNDIIATIQYVKVENVTCPDGKKEDCAVAHFVERDIKPMILNVTNMKTLEKLFHTKYIEDWAGRKIQIGVEQVKAFGDVVDALRVRKFVPKVQGAPVCEECNVEVSATDKLAVPQVISFSQKKYGKTLCATCILKRQEADKAAQQAQDAPAEAQEGVTNE